mmetsp:Transcript_17226/g.23689  ORF Transcript_17226/g.23689 Transcript_17226/m.23689 type:complete len:169 (-) Transcript_17226:461-967(-)|eukprot:CAMPEP_0185726606 /NCGR_PEP_ID=MMETSP1171-20130828/2534_1 /TAXON_ID=374046 /ORGANISM="Helicotheca tamensis, Strain CCMP826" /LENGTH=168 /DNA_ID=CAMNT_0028394991 /DNA_START=52 /DNA_END=558 /DNA_ORIENTATION=-
MALSLITTYLLALTAITSAFQTITPPAREYSISNPPLAFSTTITHVTRSKRLSAKDGDGDDYESDIDWDAEWKKVVENKDQPSTRPGKDFYKSETEIKVIQATNKAVEGAQQQIKQVQKKVVIQPPNIRSLQGDWKFWIAILAIISVGTSLIAASGQTQTYTNDSFYI